MHTAHKDIAPLVSFLKMDQFYVVCHFKCKETNKSIISSVPFEPFEGKIEISWQEMLLHPLVSYDKYYHTPITIYGEDTHETIILKAFKKVSKHFKWNQENKQYTFI